jgi:hypothetical protein
MRHRTALITAGSIAAVVFAGAIAIGTNLGILTVSDSKPVGQLTAATLVQAAAPAAPEPVAAKSTPDTQAYLIKKAGTVKVAVTKSSVRLADVAAKRHWAWKLTQSSDRKLTVTFSHGSSTYTFVAVVRGRGKLTARVDHPVTRTVPSAPSSASSWVAAVPSTPVASPSSGDHSGGESHSGGGADD